MDRLRGEHVGREKGILTAEYLNCFVVDCSVEKEDVDIQPILRRLEAMGSAKAGRSDEKSAIGFVSEFSREPEKERGLRLFGGHFLKSVGQLSKSSCLAKQQSACG